MTPDLTPTAGSAKPAAPTIDRKQHCQNICTRAVSCGIDAAEHLSRTNAKEIALVTQLKKEREASTQSCASECTEGELTDADQGSLAASDRCLEQTTCDLFSRCLGDARDTAKRR